MNSGWKSRLNKYNEEHNIITQSINVVQSGGGSKMTENAPIRKEYFDKITLNGTTYPTCSRKGIEIIKKIILLYEQRDN